MNTQNLVPINGLDANELNAPFSYSYDECGCDNANYNPGTGW